MTTTKESLVQRDVVSIVATCLRIAELNPRTQSTSLSPLTKAVRGFSRAIESMDADEIMAMAKTFYRNQYLASMASDTWLEKDVDLEYGDDVDSIRLRLSQYARVAKDLKGGVDYDTLNYHTLRLIQRLATKAVAENLDEKILPLEKKLGKSPLPATTTAPGASNIMSTLMSAVGPMMQQLTGDGDSPLKNLLANPNTASLMRNMTSNLPAELQKGLEPMLEDIQKGTFDFSKVLERIGAGAPAGPVDLIQASPSSTDDSTVITTTDVVVPSLPEACADGVCFPTDH